MKNLNSSQSEELYKKIPENTAYIYMQMFYR